MLRPLSIVSRRLNSILNVKAQVGTFNQEKAIVGVFSVIVKTNGSFAALVCTHCVLVCGRRGQLRVLRRGRGDGGQQHRHPRQPRQPQPRHR